MTKLKKQERNKMIVQLREQGKTFEEIGDIFNISRQWACEVYHRENKKVNK